MCEDSSCEAAKRELSLNIRSFKVTIDLKRPRARILMSLEI